MKTPIEWFGRKVLGLPPGGCNFAPIPVKFEGVVYLTSEHAFQAAKTWDLGQREWIRKQPSPGDAKHAGRSVELRPDWDVMSPGVVESLVRYKFRTDRRFCEDLLETEGCWIIEMNSWHDEIWGCTFHPGWVPPFRGRNLLGRCLMNVRDRALVGEGVPIHETWEHWSIPPWTEEGRLSVGGDYFWSPSTFKENSNESR